MRGVRCASPRSACSRNIFVWHKAIEGIVMSKLLQSYDMNGTLLANRVLMAPMTKSRAQDTVPDAKTALYYRQRAGAGLIVTEGSQISVEGTGYLFTPGIHTPEQIKAWKEVTNGVHEEGGKIGSFENSVGNAAQRACELNAAKLSFPAMRNKTVRMVSKRAYPRALRFAA